MMHDFFGFNPIVYERLTVTLLHFLWQGAAIGVVAAVLSRMLLRASSQVRYMIHLAALVAMCCCLPITFSLVTAPEPVAVVSTSIDESPTVSTTNDRPISDPSFPITIIDPKSMLIDPDDSSEPADASALLGQSIAPKKTSNVVMENSGEADSEVERYLPRLAPYVTAIYLAGVALLLIRLMRSAWRTSRLGRSATVVTDIDLLYRMRTQGERLGLRVLPALRWCHKVPVPVVIGVLRPIVLLPAYAATGLTMDQLQAVMAHELAHIRRYDLVVNVLQRVIESLLFFHPAVWWVSQQIANEREQACDELVLTVGPGRAQYADALVRMAELSCQFGQLPVTALATTGSSATAFKRRVLRVLEVDAAPMIRPSRLAAVTASMVALLTLAMLLSWSGALASGGSGFGTLPVAVIHPGQLEHDLKDERAAWRELDRLRVFDAVSGRPGWSENLRQAIDRNDQNEIAKYQHFLDDIPTTADIWHIPDEAWPVIGRLKSLTQVRFVASDLRGRVGHLRGLKNLRKFETLTKEFLPDDLAELGGLTNLEVIDVDLGTWFQTEEEIAKMVAKLSEEDRQYCQQTGNINDTKHHLSMLLTDAALAKLRNLKQLKVLDLQFTYVTGKGVEQLAQFPNLEQFSVDEWYLLTPASMRALGTLANLRKLPRLPSGATELLEPLAGLRQLEVLEIAGGDLTDEGMSHLQGLGSLKRLDILHSQVTDTGLLHLANLHQLKWLDIRGVKAVTDAGVRQLRERLPNCQIIHTDVEYNAFVAANEVAADQPTSPKVQPKAVDSQPDVKVGMTFDEVIRIKTKLFDAQVVDAQTNQPVTGGKVTVRYSFDRHALETAGKPLRNVFVSQEEFDLTEAGTFPIRIPRGMEDARLQLQTSIRHPEYVIEQSFGYWPMTTEMAANPDLAKQKLFGRGVIKLKRGHEVSGIVTDVLEQPVAGVRVYAAMQMPEYLNMPPHAVTDAQGRYKFRVPEHDGYRLMFVPAGRDTSAADSDTPGDLAAKAQMDLLVQSIPIREEYGEHPVVKLQSGTRIVGVVRNSAGQPLSNIVVQANGSDSVYMGFPQIMSRVVTDAAGRYELPAQKIPVDVRISRHNSLGGWSEPAAIPAELYMPEFVTARWGKRREGDANVYEVDFAPVKSVTLRAWAYNTKGQPDSDADIELIASVPVPGAGPEQRGPFWRRSFTAVPGEVGLYELKAPLGLLEARIDLTSEGLGNPAVKTWSRAVLKGENLEGPRTNSAWTVLDQDDDTIVVGEPTELQPTAGNNTLDENELQPIAPMIPPGPKLISGFGRSAIGLMQGEKLLVAFYARGSIKLDTKQVRDQFDEQGNWSINFTHTTEQEKTHKYHLAYLRQSPNEVRINDRVIPLGLDIIWGEGASPTHGLWCGLTSYGRCQPTERWHDWFEALVNAPEKSELSPQRKYSWAWYLDNDLYEFESYRSTLEMDELINVVVAWDEQHQIQHSDGARAAKLRVLADGRVYVCGNGREAIRQYQLSQTELKELLFKLIPLCGEPEPPLVPGQIRLKASRGALWDSELESITLTHGGKIYRVHHKGPSPGKGPEEKPLHWDEIVALLGSVMDSSRFVVDKQGPQKP